MDKDRNVYVKGGNEEAGTSIDVITIKYSQPNGIIPISGNVSTKFCLSQNYPNPFNPTTKIKFDIPPIGQRHAFDVRMIIFDVLGREVNVLANQQLTPGRYEVDFDGSNYPSGIYFYSLFVNGKLMDAKKMVLVK